MCQAFHRSCDMSKLTLSSLLKDKFRIDYEDWQTFMKLHIISHIYIQLSKRLDKHNCKSIIENIIIHIYS